MSTAPTPSPAPEETPRASQDVERARYASLRTEALDDPDGLGRDQADLDAIRERDTNPEDDELRRDGPSHLRTLNELTTALRRLIAAASTHAQRSAPPTTPGANIDVIPETFWTAPVAELGGVTGEAFVQANIIVRELDLIEIVDSELWVRGRDMAIHNQLRAVLGDAQANFVHSRATCPISDLRAMLGRVTQASGSMDTALRGARQGHDARHEPVPAIAGEYIDWRGTEDPEADAMLGVIRRLQDIANHRFWQLAHEAGQPTIAQRARELIARIQRSMLITGPGRCTVQNMNEVSTALRDLADIMRVFIGRERKADDLQVDQGTDAHERSASNEKWLNRGLWGAGAALVLAAALAVQSCYNVMNTEKKDVSSEVKPRESDPKKLTSDVWVLLRGERTLVFDLPKDVATDTIRDRYQFFLKPRMGAGKPRQTVPMHTSKGWTLELTDEEAASGGVLISVHEHTDGIWKTASEDTLIVTHQPETPAETKAEDKERVVDLSPDCRVHIKGDAMTVKLPAAITPANIEKKFAFFIAKEGDTPPGRYVSLTQGADGWAGSLTADELAKGEVTLTIWDDSTGRVLPRGTPTKIKLK